MKEFDWKSWNNKNKHLVIYGASSYGKLAYYSLKSHNIEPDFFCDNNKAGKSLFGVPIISVKKVKELEELNVLIASFYFFEDMKQSLEKEHIENYFSIYELLNNTDFTRVDLEPYLLNTKVLIDMYHFSCCKENNKETGKLYITSIDLVITEQCSLKCEHCSNLMQYYVNPQNGNFDGLTKAFDLFLSCVEEIGELRIIGGEPFMNKEIYKYIDYYVKNTKIVSIGVYSNATIIPEERIMAALKNEKVTVHLSDYGEIAKNRDRVMESLRKYQIRYDINKLDEWQDLGKLEKRNYSLAELKKLYQLCDCKELPTFLNGKLYACPYSAHTVNLSALPKQEAKMEFVDFSGEKIEPAIYKERITKLLYKSEYLMACGYCSGRILEAEGVKPARQINSPLPYEKYDKLG